MSERAGGALSERVYDVVVIGGGPVEVALVPCFPSIGEVRLRLLEAYRG